MQVADRWFDHRKIEDDVTLIWEPHVVPFLRCNIWHVRGRDRDLLIDTGMGIVSLRAFAKDILEKPVSAVATHTHLDHIGGHYEFDECIVHRLEEHGLLHPTQDTSLIGPGFDPYRIETLSVPPLAGYDLTGAALTMLPDSEFDLTRYAIRPVKATRAVEDGDVIDLGDRVLEVMHLPGHSPGSIGLWEARSGTLFSGDAIYDGPLLDSLHHSNVTDYRRSLERLLTLPVRVVHAGHEASFGRARLREIVETYLTASVSS
jgi:glyoxylase-like metal-dependent hydrolase (beta-lactamase superfamily II)